MAQSIVVVHDISRVVFQFDILVFHGLKMLHCHLLQLVQRLTTDYAYGHEIAGVVFAMVLQEAVPYIDAFFSGLID